MGATTRGLQAIFKTFLIPPLLTRCFLLFAPQPLLLRLCLYIASLPFAYALRCRLSTYRHTLAARRLGASTIPSVKGRYPLNIDVLLDWARSGSEEEVGRMMVLLGRSYGGTYNTGVLGDVQIITTDPRVVRHALVDDFDNFVKGEKTRSRAKEFLGDGIFNADGERWKFHRSLTRPFFHPTHIPPSLFTPHIFSTFSAFPLLGNDGIRSDAFDIQEMMGELSLRIAVEWLCGVDLAAPHSRGHEWDKAKRGVGEAMRVAQGVVARRMKIGDTWPLFELGKNPLVAPMRTIRAFFRPLIEEALDRHDTRKGVGNLEGEKMRLIDRLVDATNDLKLIEDQLINILLASRDTTSSLLTFCVYALALHPKIYDRVRVEILDTAGLEKEISKEIIRDCPYTRRFVNETLRLFPPVPLNIRRTLQPTLLPTSSGERLYMPANTALVICTILMQRDRAVWGEDAEEFDPDRWETDGGVKGREAFAAWNLGPRMCLGQPFALTAIHTFLILLVRYLTALRARIELAPDAQPAGTRIPDYWVHNGGEKYGNTGSGDGRARGGRDRVWIVSDVVLAVKGGLWVRLVR